MNRRSFITTFGALVAAPLAFFTKKAKSIEPPHPMFRGTPMVCVWRGGQDGKWNDPQSWKNGIIPQDGDDVIVPDYGKCMAVDVPPICLRNVSIGHGAEIGVKSTTTNRHYMTFTNPPTQ